MERRISFANQQRMSATTLSAVANMGLLSTTASTVSATSITKYTASIPSVDTLLIKPARPATEPDDRTIGLHFALDLLVTALSAHQIGVSACKITFLVGLETVTQAPAATTPVAISHNRKYHHQNAKQNCQKE
jgi:hypothetical protein